MINTILGSKEKMSQAFVEGTRVSVTWIKAGPCIVTQIKNMQKDGYWAVQLGFGERKLKNISKPLQGHFKKSFTTKDKFPRFLREVRLGSEPDVKVGDVIKLSDVFKKGDVVAVSGISKGKGFSGVVKRWHFAGGSRTHGQSDREKAPGSIGQGTTPGRVYKGKKMAGRMGSDRVTIKNLIVVDTKEDDELIALSGPVPGTSKGVLIIKKIGEGKLSELVEEVHQVEVQQVEEAEESKGEKSEAKEEKKAEASTTEKTSGSEGDNK